MCKYMHVKLFLLNIMIIYIYLICLISLSSGQIQSFNGDDYYESPRELTFDEAISFCASNQAQLADVKSPEIRQWLKTTFNKHLYIGLFSADGKDGVFKWLDGSNHTDSNIWYDSDCTATSCCAGLHLPSNYGDRLYKKICSAKYNALCQISRVTLKARQVSDTLHSLSSKTDSLVDRFNSYVGETEYLFQNIAGYTQHNHTLLVALGKVNTDLREIFGLLKTETKEFVYQLTVKLSTWKRSSFDSRNETLKTIEQYLNETEFFQQHQLRLDQIESEFDDSLKLHNLVHDKLNISDSRVKSLNNRYDDYLNESSTLIGPIFLESAKVGSQGLLDIIDEIHNALRAHVFEYQRQTAKSIDTAQVGEQVANSSSYLSLALNQVQFVLERLESSEYLVNHELLRVQIDRELTTSVELQKEAYEKLNVINSKIDTLKTYHSRFSHKLMLFRQILDQNSSDDRRKLILSAVDEISTDVNQTVCQFETDKNLFVVSAFKTASKTTVVGPNLLHNQIFNSIKMLNDLLSSSPFSKNQETRLNIFQSDMESDFFLDRLLFVKMTSLTVKTPSTNLNEITVNLAKLNNTSQSTRKLLNTLMTSSRNSKTDDSSLLVVIVGLVIILLLIALIAKPFLSNVQQKEIFDWFDEMVKLNTKAPNKTTEPITSV